MVPERISKQTFFGASILLFAVSAAVTIIWSHDMSAMDGMPMPGGWTMSMTWMTGENWVSAAGSFLAMWIVMMVAMMMPSLTPMLWSYHQVVGATGGTHPGWLTALAGLGYFFVWTAFGVLLFPLGVALATAEMQSPALAHAVPLIIGVVVLAAGALQFTRWKQHHLTCCRSASGYDKKLPANTAMAWRQGLRFGLNCVQCCFGLMMILLVIGVMDLRAMLMVATAITIERLMPAGGRIARITGVVVVAAGLLLIAQAARP